MQPVISTNLLNKIKLRSSAVYKTLQPYNIGLHSVLLSDTLYYCFVQLWLGEKLFYICGQLKNSGSIFLIFKIFIFWCHSHTDRLHRRTTAVSRKPMLDFCVILSLLFTGWVRTGAQLPLHIPWIESTYP